MANRKDVFYFKQFAVKHSKSAMKVGFDGILLGAWCDIDEDKVILDVGTGTGLIALMVAQRNKSAMICAIEPDRDSYIEANANFNSSSWKSRIVLKNQSLQEFAKESRTKFDHIVCNPPYFHDGQKSNEDRKAKARHAIDLTFEDLLRCSKSLLVKNGKLSIILPPNEGQKLIDKAKKINFSVLRICEVYTKTKVERMLISHSLTDDLPNSKSLLNIYTAEGDYTQEYINMVKDFYWKM